MLLPPQVEETDYGTLKGVLAAIKRGRQLKCSHCKRKGATLGCRVPSCSCTCVASQPAKGSGTGGEGGLKLDLEGRGWLRGSCCLLCHCKARVAAV